MGEEALQLRTRTLGQEHPDTQRSMVNLSLICGHQGRLSETETLQVKVLEARKRIMGPDHPGTLESMSVKVHEARAVG